MARLRWSLRRCCSVSPPPTGLARLHPLRCRSPKTRATSLPAGPELRAPRVDLSDSLSLVDHDRVDEGITFSRMTYSCGSVLLLAAPPGPPIGTWPGVQGLHMLVDREGRAANESFPLFRLSVPSSERPTFSRHFYGTLDRSLCALDWQGAQ